MVIRFSDIDALTGAGDVLQAIADALTLPSPAAAGEGSNGDVNPESAY